MSVVDTVEWINTDYGMNIDNDSTKTIDINTKSTKRRGTLKCHLFVTLNISVFLSTLDENLRYRLSPTFLILAVLSEHSFIKYTATIHPPTVLSIPKSLH